jgi:hypothetical protein
MTAITHFDKLPWTPYAGHRGGHAQYKRLAVGESRSPGNFEFTVMRMTGEGDVSPRHRHNFDQIRMPLLGDANYSPGLDVPNGWIGYFPEGTPYGPQRVAPGTELLLLQFGGASGSGFLDYEQLARGHGELTAAGEFRGGVFHRTAGEGRRTQDGFEAVYEHVMKRPVSYPAPRYREPVVLNPDAFRWTTLAAGVGEKLLGGVGERSTTITLLRLDDGVSHRVVADTADRLIFVRSGVAEIDGERCAPRDAAHVVRGTAATLRGFDRAELLVIGLPDLRGVSVEEAEAEPALSR